MAVLDNLKNAILDVLGEAELQRLGGGTTVYLVPGNVLYYLQQEYNIHFIEPEEEQLEVIE